MSQLPMSCQALRHPCRFLLQTPLVAHRQKRELTSRSKKMKQTQTKNIPSSNQSQLQIQSEQAYPQRQLGIGLDNHPRIQIIIPIKRLAAGTTRLKATLACSNSSAYLRATFTVDPRFHNRSIWHHQTILACRLNQCSISVHHLQFKTLKYSTTAIIVASKINQAAHYHSMRISHYSQLARSSYQRVSLMSHPRLPENATA